MYTETVCNDNFNYLSVNAALSRLNLNIYIKLWLINLTSMINILNQ